MTSVPCQWPSLKSSSAIKIFHSGFCLSIICYMWLLYCLRAETVILSKCYHSIPFPLFMFFFLFLPLLLSFFFSTVKAMVNCCYARRVWHNYITVCQIPHIWLRTTMCERSLLMWSGPADLVGGSAKRSAEAALIQLVSFGLFLRFFQIFGSRRGVLTMWARSYVALFPDLTTTKWNNLFHQPTI